jgi:hypothetical protein
MIVCELCEKSKIDVILCKSLSVLPETELLQPVGNLLHRGSAPHYRAHPPVFTTLSEKPETL